MAADPDAHTSQQTAMSSASDSLPRLPSSPQSTSLIPSATSPNPSATMPHEPCDMVTSPSSTPSPVQPPSIAALTKWKDIPFDDTTFLRNRPQSPPWAVAPTDVFQRAAILKALNTASGNTVFAQCVQDTSKLAVFQGVLGKPKNPDHLTPSEKITILMAADYLYVLWRANIPSSHQTVRLG